MHCRFILILLLSFFATQLWAVDASVLWLPKKFNDVKPKLMVVAEKAESSDRCQHVVAGEMNLSKTTDDNYYFVITCRDESRSTYNISYQYPKVGDEIIVVNEQVPFVAAASNQDENLTDEEQEAAELLASCYQGFNAEGAGENMCRGSVDDARIEELCTEAKSFDAALVLCNKPLTSEEALAVCHEVLDDEAILFGQINVLHDLITAQNHSEEWAFRFHMPFDNVTRKGELIRYKADCRVTAEEDADMDTRIDIEAIPSMCTEAVEKEVKKMLSVTILTDEISEVVEEPYNFYMKIPFNAKDPVGRTLNYEADCNVDDNGRSSVDISPRK